MHWLGKSGFSAMVVASMTVSAGAIAQPLVPGPNAGGFDAALADKASGWERQLHAIMTPQVGWGLEAVIEDPADRTLVDDFIASGRHDFEAFAGKHVYEVVTRFDEYRDLGMFGGVQAAGDAFRYASLRDGGAPASDVDRARQHVLRALEGMHWYTQITGTPGVMARGIRRVTSDDGVALPDVAPETVPLFDDAMNPLPADKEPTWRADQSGELPFLIWLDDTSKDQVDGYVFALGVFYDLLVDDPAIPTTAIDTLRADAASIGRALMQKTTVGFGPEADMVLMDADGRPTTYHDLSAEEILPGAVFDEALNGFNGLLGMGVMRTLFHISGDAEIGRFYRSLVDERGYLEAVRDSIGIMYTGPTTNNSNINMAFIAMYNVLRYETDPAIQDALRTILAQQMFAPGKDREAKALGQALFDFIYAAFVNAADTEDAISAGNRMLAGARPPPYWQTAVTHCDDEELAARFCIAEDGTTEITLEAEGNWHDLPVATAPLPIELRVPSNYHFRTDPHLVNQEASSRLNPAGGLHCAYWMGRYLQRVASTDVNLSPHARQLPELTPSDAVAPSSTSCACVVAGPSLPDEGWLWWVAAALVALVRRRS